MEPSRCSQSRRHSNISLCVREWADAKFSWHSTGTTNAAIAGGQPALCLEQVGGQSSSVCAVVLQKGAGAQQVSAARPCASSSHRGADTCSSVHHVAQPQKEADETDQEAGPAWTAGSEQRQPFRAVHVEYSGAPAVAHCAVCRVRSSEIVAPAVDSILLLP